MSTFRCERVVDAQIAPVPHMPGTKRVRIERRCSAKRCPFGGQFDPTDLLVTPEPGDGPNVIKDIAQGASQTVYDQLGDTCDAVRP